MLGEQCYQARQWSPTRFVYIREAYITVNPDLCVQVRRLSGLQDMKNTQLSRLTDETGKTLQRTVDRKRGPGLCRSEWSGEKVVEIHPEDTAKAAAE
ncbi:hypothetical protein [Asticcacaulis taihuensis]|nr:hypothetical protein [Asticcacaulis taihuensis]